MPSYSLTFAPAKHEKEYRWNIMELYSEATQEDKTAGTVGQRTMKFKRSFINNSRIAKPTSTAFYFTFDP